MTSQRTPISDPSRTLPPQFPGPQSRSLFEQEQKYLAPGLQTIALYSQLALERGQGCLLFDADGHSYLDFTAGVAVASLGHSHPRYVAALEEQLEKLTVGSYTTDVRARFVQRLATVTPPGLSRVQLYSSGAEAVESAIRLAKSYTKKFELIGFWGGFHGKTGGVLGLLGDDFKKELGPWVPGTYLAPYPNPFRCPLGTRGAHDCAGHCAEFLETIIEKSTSGKVAAILIEPIQGTAGNVIPAPGFLKQVREIARSHDALLIADEMITGFGRTGRMWGCEWEGVTPDILTLGKGMANGFPVSAVLTTEEISQAAPWANPSGSSSSYGGNPLAAAACRVTLEIILEEKLPQNAQEIGHQLLQRLRGLQEKYRFIGEVRGRGLLIGVELVEDPKTQKPLQKKITREVFQECLRRGLLSMSYSHILRINPPLILTQEEADRGLEILDSVFSTVAQKFHLQ
ncbi:MAG: aspartate aminotransferase family protein [Elusimicrobia bacterium]|nr:aspartate aminotransferase family protein [Elusimicrobiota bacterium]